jgi:hypothetical protein
MSFENRLKRGLEARAADMEEDVTTALRGVREKAERKRRMQFAGAAVAAAALFATGALAGPSILDAMRGTDPDPGIPIGGDDTPSPTPEPTSEPSPTPEATPTEETAADAVARPVWFTSGEMLQSTTRYVAVAEFEDQAHELLVELLGQPNATETQNGLGTAIPSGTDLLGVTLQNRMATVDLSGSFAAPGDLDGIGQRVGQIAWTLSELAPDGVTITVEGTALNLDGLDVRSPYTTDEFESLLMPITVFMPYAGQEMRGDAIRIAGTANVFEATVTVRVIGERGESLLVNKKGKTIEETFTTATCGSGCRGTFEMTPRIRTVTQSYEAVVEVYEVSAESGEPINLVRIPVTLHPSADGN